MTVVALPAAALRLPCFDFDDVPVATVFELGSHERAREAIDLGLSTPGHHYNIYVAGPDQAGRMTTTRTYVEQWANAQPPASDWIYLEDFDVPASPQPVTLPAGVGCRFQQAINSLIPTLGRELAAVFESEDYQQQMQQLRSRDEEDICTRSDQLEARAREMGLVLASTPEGPTIAALDEAGAVVPLESLSPELRDPLMENSAAIRDSKRNSFSPYMRWRIQQPLALPRDRSIP